jgi:hypothetical protein
MDQSEQDNERDVPSYGLLYITRAHNQGEIDAETWLQLAIAWAEAMLKQQPPEPPTPD